MIGSPDYVINPRPSEFIFFANAIEVSCYASAPYAFKRKRC